MLKEALYPCEKKLPEGLMQGQDCARGSRSSQALGKGCFSPREPGPKEGKKLWMHPGSSVPKKITFVRKHS